MYISILLYFEFEFISQASPQTQVVICFCDEDERMYLRKSCH
jgi:hypothetical protein